VQWRNGLGPEFLAVWGRPNGRVDPEHVSIYGPSGSGKSYFMCHIMIARARLRGSHAVMVATKRADKTLTEAGWPIIHEWPPDYGQKQVIFWARGGLSDEQQEKQTERVRGVMNELWQPNANTIVAWDELPYVASDLGLRRPLTTYYREGRGLGITNVAVMQRPTDVPRYVHSECGWTVAFRPKDADDRDRVAEVFGHRQFYRDVLESLDREGHEFLMRRELTGETFISSLPAPRKPPQRRGYGRGR
jgi:hypothetical protein